MTTTRPLVLRFDAFGEDAGTVQAALAALAGIIGGGFGAEWLRGLRQRRADKRRSDQGFEVKILDEGAALRHEANARAERLQSQVIELLERSHRAELRAAELTAVNLELRDRLTRSHTVTDGLLKLRSQVQAGAEKAAGEEA